MSDRPSHDLMHNVTSTRNLGPVVIGVDFAVFAVSTIVVLIRLYTRLWITHNFGWDDAASALTQAITACAKGFAFKEVSHGLGRHKDSLSTQDYKQFLKYNFLDSCQFFWALAMLKISVCLFLLRLSQFDRLKRALWTLIGFLLASTLVLSLLIILQCQPISKAWHINTPGKCFSTDTIMKITITQGAISILTDFLCALFPLLLLRNLNIRPRSKLALCCLMGLGIITGLIAIARTATTPLALTSHDITWTSVPNAFYRMFEVNVGNAAACVPILKPFVRYVCARCTGRDPHGILVKHRRASSSAGQAERHGGWLVGFWCRRRRGINDGEGIGTTQRLQNAELPPGVLKMRAMGGALSPFSISTTRSGSLGLPVQGVRRGSSPLSVPGWPNVRYPPARYHQDPGWRCGRGSKGLRNDFEGFDFWDGRDGI